MAPITAPPAWARRSTSSASAPRRRCARARTSSSCPTAPPAPTACRSPRCSRPAAVHHHLIRCGLRTSVGLVVETGEAYEVHQFATLAGYGAEAINPYLAFETIEAMLPELDEELTPEEAVKRYIKATDKGLLKVMSKMGISTYQSYCGAQIFDAVGLRSDFVAKYFTGTNSQVEGVGLEEIARETVERHSLAFSDAPVLREALEVGGEYAYRIRGEAHMWRPQVVADLQHAVRGSSAREVPRLRQADQRADRAAADAARHVPHQDRRGDGPQADPARSGRARQGHRQALLDRGHVVRLDQPRGAHHARHRHEPHRRQVEHRRRRRGVRPLPSRCRTATRCARRSSRWPRAASA